FASSKAVHASGQIGAVLSLANSSRSPTIVVCYASFPAKSITIKRDCLTDPSPRASGFRQANLLHLLLRNCLKQFHFHFESQSPIGCVWNVNFFLPARAAVPPF